MINTSPETEEAILASMGATTDEPQPVARAQVSDERSAPAPDRVWGWALQVYALRSKESWGIGDFADLRRFGRWARSTGASIALLNPLGAQLPTVPYPPSRHQHSGGAE